MSGVLFSPPSLNTYFPDSVMLGFSLRVEKQNLPKDVRLMIFDKFYGRNSSFAGVSTGGAG
jgi:hypothetical protein